MIISVRVIKMLRNRNQHNFFVNYGSLIALISKAIITLRAHRFSNFRLVALIAPGVQLLLHIRKNHPFPAPAEIIHSQLQEWSSSVVSNLDRSFWQIKLVCKLASSMSADVVFLEELFLELTKLFSVNWNKYFFKWSSSYLVKAVRYRL